MPSIQSLLLSETQQESVIQATDCWIERASVIFGQQFKHISVVFDLKGRTSGMFCTEGKRHWIRYNPWIFAKHFDDSLSTTVPHEVAHYICFKLYGRNHRPHGPEWKAVMGQFGVSANATCKLDISDIPQKQLKRFAYKCNCRIHELTSIRHNRIVRGTANYSCQKCGADLEALKSG